MPEGPPRILHEGPRRILPAGTYRTLPEGLKAFYLTGCLSTVTTGLDGVGVGVDGADGVALAAGSDDVPHRWPHAAGHSADCANHVRMCATWPPWPHPWHHRYSPRAGWWQIEHWLTNFWHALHAK